MQADRCAVHLPKFQAELGLTRRSLTLRPHCDQGPAAKPACRARPRALLLRIHWGRSGNKAGMHTVAIPQSTETGGDCARLSTTARRTTEMSFAVEPCLISVHTRALALSELRWSPAKRLPLFPDAYRRAIFAELYGAAAADWSHTVLPIRSMLLVSRIT